MKQYETTKLFYNKYAYKVVIRCDLTGIFASYQGKDHARKTIEKLEADRVAGKDLFIQKWRGEHRVTVHTLEQVRAIYNSLQKYTDYRVRAEYSYNLTIYTNTEELVNLLEKKVKYNVKEIWRPREGMVKFLTSNIETAVIKTAMPYEFRVYFKGGGIDPSFARWLEKNTDKSRVGSSTLATIARGGWLGGNYFYVKNEKVLTMIRMLVGHNIRKVERLVYIEDIDK